MAHKLEAAISRLSNRLRERKPALASLGIAAISLFLFAEGRSFIADTAPYVQHIDERTLMRGARRVLQDDGLNPRIYNYPSLPFYLTAVGVAWGAVKASARGPDRVVMKRLGRLEPPYYELMAAGTGARMLWLLLALGCVVAAAGCSYALAGPGAALLSSLILGLAGIPTLSASLYVSVDVPLTLFCSLLLALLALTFVSTSYRNSVWVPALLCGAAIACKYTGVLTLVPALLAVWLRQGSSRFSRSVELLLLTTAVFLLLCPRFLLELPKFLDGISYESHHYGFKGHKRFTVTPGWEQMWSYLRDAADAFGTVLLLIAAIGVVDCTRKEPRITAALLSFPCAWLLMLCNAKVHFTRNLLPVLVWIGIFAAIGVYALWGFAGRFGARVHQARGALAGHAALALLIGAALPWQSIWARHHRAADSRVKFARWAAKNLRDETTLIIPSALPFAEETLDTTLHVRRVDLRDPIATAQMAESGAYMLVPTWTTAAGGVSTRVAELAPGMNALPSHRVVREFDGLPAAPFLESELSINPTMRLVRFE